MDLDEFIAMSDIDELIAKAKPEQEEEDLNWTVAGTGSSYWRMSCHGFWTQFSNTLQRQKIRSHGL